MTHLVHRRPYTHLVQQMFRSFKFKTRIFFSLGKTQRAIRKPIALQLQDVIVNMEEQLNSSSMIDTQSNTSNGISPSLKSISIQVQTELSMFDIDNLEQKLSSLQNENKGHYRKDYFNDTYLYLNIVFPFLEFLLTMMRLCFNLTFQELAYPNSFEDFFNKWIDAMATERKFIKKWPDREELQKTMPHDFLQVYGRKVVVVIDCLDVFMERPSDLLARACTWSNYKHQKTVKFFIGICPEGWYISFLSFPKHGEVAQVSNILQKITRFKKTASR